MLISKFLVINCELPAVLWSKAVSPEKKAVISSVNKEHFPMRKRPKRAAKLAGGGCSVRIMAPAAARATLRDL